MFHSCLAAVSSRRACARSGPRERLHSCQPPFRPGRRPARRASPSPLSIRPARWSAAPPSTVTGTDDVTKAGGPTTVTTSNDGIGTLPNLVPGRYTIEAQFPGFEPRVLANVAVRAGQQQAGRAAHGGGVEGQRHRRARPAGSGGRPARHVVRHACSRAIRSRRSRTTRWCCGSSSRRWPAPAP